MLDHPGSSSDSYLHSLLFHLIESYPPDALVLTTTPIRGSPDYIEYSLTTSSTPFSSNAEASSSSSVASTSNSSSPFPTTPAYLDLPPPNTVLFKAAKCYGFKNLQNVVRKTKSSSLPSSSSMISSRRAPPKGYDYVEVMACPSGCVNGGGQLKPPNPSLASNAPASLTSLPAPTPQVEAKIDEEGFPRPWEAMDTSAAQVVDAEMRWSTKEWVARVESIYWGREPKPTGDTTTSGGAATPLKVSKETARSRRGHGGVWEVVREREEEVRAEMGGVGGEGDGWVRTSYEEIKPEEDGMLLGSGVVW